MAIIIGRDEGWRQNEKRAFQVSVTDPTGTPTNLTGVNLEWLLLRNQRDPDPPQLFKSGNDISITGASNNVVNFTVTDAESGSLADGFYWTELWDRDNDVCLLAGNAVLQPGHASPAGLDITTPYLTAGNYTYTIPNWADYLDYVMIGGGGGGARAARNGGGAATWTTGTLARGTDIPTTTTTISGTVGKGGKNVTTNNNSAGNGQASTASATGWTGGASAAGGLGSSNTGLPGASPGSVTYNNITYPGGAVQNTQGATGNAPGGGGAAGGMVAIVFIGNGGFGGTGATWWRAYRYR